MQTDKDQDQDEDEFYDILPSPEGVDCFGENIMYMNFFILQFQNMCYIVPCFEHKLYHLALRLYGSYFCKILMFIIFCELI